MGHICPRQGWLGATAVAAWLKQDWADTVIMITESTVKGEVGQNIEQ